MVIKKLFLLVLCVIILSKYKTFSNVNLSPKTTLDNLRKNNTSKNSLTNDFYNNLSTVQSVNDILNLIIPKLLINKKYYNLNDTDIRKNINTTEQINIMWECWDILFEIFNSPNKKIYLNKSLKIAKRLDEKFNIKDKGHFFVVNMLSEAYWEEWHRQLSMDELRKIAKYGKLYNRAGFMTFFSLGKYPSNDKLRYSSIISPYARSSNWDLILVFKIPSYRYEGSSNLGNITLYGLPYKRNVKFPTGYFKDLNSLATQILTRIKNENELTSLDVRFIDIYNSLAINQKAYSEKLDILMYRTKPERIFEIKELLKQIKFRQKYINKMFGVQKLILNSN